MAEKRTSYPSFHGKKVCHKFFFTLWSLETQCKGDSWCWLNRSSSIQLWLFSGWLWECCWQPLETGLLSKSTVSKGPGLRGTDFKKKLRKGSFHEDKTHFWDKRWIDPTVCIGALYASLWWGKQDGKHVVSAAAGLSKTRRSRMQGTCKSPFWLGLKYLQNSYLSSAEKSFRK